MVTVRTTAPRSDVGNNRKRKRKSQDNDTSSSSSAVDVQLQTLENWQRALTLDMRELRREGARVRLELEKVDDMAEAAVARAERSAKQAEAAQEHAQAAAKAKDERDAQLETLAKRFAGTDKRIEKMLRVSVDEEMLMTQLTGLQEQYEDELRKVREEHDAALQKQQKQLDALRKTVVKVLEDAKHVKPMDDVEKMIQRLKDENTRVNHKLTLMATKQEMQQQLQAVEREYLDEQGRTRADLNGFEDKLNEVDTRVADVEGKVTEVRKPAREPMPMPMPMPPPLPLPRDVVRQGDLAVIHDTLRRVNRDLRVAAVDVNALAKRMDGRDNQQQFVEMRLEELSKQLFDALSHDSKLHVNEISRLKETVFDLQNDHREFGKRMRRLEDDVQQATAARAEPRSPLRDRGGSGWRYGQTQPPVLPMPPVLPPPPPPTHRNRRERPSRYEPAHQPAPDFRGNAAPAFEPPAQDRIRWEPRRRSRSRSPPRRSWGAAGNNSLRSDSGFTSTQGDRHPPHDDRRITPDRNNSGNARSVVTELSDLPPAQDNRESSEGQSIAPFRRSRQPRRTPEIIVIEEDDDDDESAEEENTAAGDNAAEQEGNGEAADDTVPSTARPDIVLDEEESTQDADVTTEAAPPDGFSAAQLSDRLEKEFDLQTGFLLYFCLGGAPDLGVQWTNSFSQLTTDECVDMPRAINFQRRYGFLQTFPVDLTQCILQSVIINGQHVHEAIDSESSRLTGALNASSISAKFDEMVKDIHLSWAKALIDYLLKLANKFGDLASQKLELALNPAGLSSATDKDEIIYEWSRRQESVMWILARKLHYGSFLPPLKYNGNASPAVYLFTLMFDLCMVSTGCPESGTFRLNPFGAKLIAHLWDQTLKKLPYVFFADWSWLDDQSTKQKLPALGFCHLLASILLWNSAIDRHSLTNRNIYATAVKHLLPRLSVGGQLVYGPENTEASVLLLSECESTRIEFWDLDNRFASILGLDNFFEVMEGIQNNMLTVAAAAPCS